MEEIYETMFETFDKVPKRVLEAVKQTDLKALFEQLESIEGATLVTGVGGSSVAATFLAKVLSKKNGIIATPVFPRDCKYMNLDGYKNVVACSYSGRNVGVDVSLENNLNKYVYSIGHRDNVTNLNYVVTDEEFSFVSLAGTISPMAMAFLYYKNDVALLEEILNTKINFKIQDGRCFEVLYGYEDATSARFLDSTLVEGGLGECILQEKYNMCHGRIIHQTNYQDSSLIYFDQNSELDNVYKTRILPFYKNAYVIERKYEDDIVNDFYTTYVAMQLCRDIAAHQGKDLSLKSVPEESEILYRFKGQM